MNRAEKIQRRSETLENTFTSFSDEKRKAAICRMSDQNFRQAIYKLASARINRRYEHKNQPIVTQEEIAAQKTQAAARRYSLKKFEAEMSARKLKMAKPIKKLKFKPMVYTQYLKLARIIA